MAAEAAGVGVEVAAEVEAVEVHLEEDEVVSAGVEAQEEEDSEVVGVDSNRAVVEDSEVEAVKMSSELFVNQYTKYWIINSFYYSQRPAANKAKLTDGMFWKSLHETGALIV